MSVINSGRDTLRQRDQHPVQTCSYPRSHPLARSYILFIDDIHTVTGPNAQQGGGVMDASILLKPLLSRGELRCIGATTLDKYRKFIEKDPALERRFQQVRGEEGVYTFSRCVGEEGVDTYSRCAREGVWTLPAGVRGRRVWALSGAWGRGACLSVSAFACARAGEGSGTGCLSGHVLYTHYGYLSTHVLLAYAY